MDAQVTAVLISGGAALTVAVLGIGGAITAQLAATRAGFENSLALQERQYAKQEKERQEQSRREDAYRFAEQRRSTYGRFVRQAREFLHVVDMERSAAENLERIDKHRKRIKSGSDGLEMSAEVAGQLVVDARERKRQIHGEFGTACEEIYLLGSVEVRTAADRLWDETHMATNSADSGYTTARTTFLEAARHELGIMTSQRFLNSAEPPVGEPQMG
jgi:hypothetical protein